MGLFSSRLAKRTRLEVATILENFVEGRGGPRDWDDFIFLTIEDPELDAIRGRCDGLDFEFPREQAGHFCGPGGIEVIRGFISRLRA